MPMLGTSALPWHAASSQTVLATIVKAVEEGRLVYQNLKKVVLYLLATSMAEVLVLLSALLCGLPLPLAAVQILWINIVTEGAVTVNLIFLIGLIASSVLWVEEARKWFARRRGEAQHEAHS